jgi:glycosyl transferase family 2
MLAATMESVLGGTELPTEIIVVDQSDHAVDEAATSWHGRGCDVRYLWTTSIGLSRANNLAAAAARHDVLVFTHDDVRVTATWFSHLVRSLVTAGPGAVTTGKVPPGEPELPGGFQQTVRVADAPMQWKGRTRAYPLLVLNMALQRRVYEAVGGFDERLGPGTAFPGAEDIDLGFRLLEAGFHIVYVPDAVLYHRAWRPPETYFGIRWDYGVALGGYFGKHLSLRDPWIARNMVGVIRLRAWRGLKTLSTDSRKSRGDLLSAAGILVGIMRWWRIHGIAGTATTPGSHA